MRQDHDIVAGVEYDILEHCLTPEQIEGLGKSAAGYVQNSQRFKAGLNKVG